MYTEVHCGSLEAQVALLEMKIEARSVCVQNWEGAEREQ
jgi:hypothetical protein